MSAAFERLGRNQALFREVNERIMEVGDPAAEPIGLVCERSDPQCTETIFLSRAEYEAVCAHAGRFLVAPGHDVAEIEAVVAERDGYVVVEKLVGTGTPRAARRPSAGS